MKKLLLILFAVVLMSATAFGQQDPLDAGEQDSLVLQITQPNVEGNDSTFTAELYFLNDVQNLSSASVGFDWDNPKVVMDSAELSPAADAAFSAVKVILYKNNLDSTNFYRYFQFSGAGIFGSLAANVNRQLVATYWFHVEGWGVGDSVVFDTNTFSSGVNMKFVDDATNQYRPAWGGPSSIKDISGITVLNHSGLPTAFAVRQNYPNPFNPSTIIEFDVPVRSSVKLTVFNVLGQVVTDLVDEEMPAGAYIVDWDGTSDSGNRVASGIYFYRISAGDFVKTKKMMMLK